MRPAAVEDPRKHLAGLSDEAVARRRSEQRASQAERAAAAARLVEASPALCHDGDEACPARHVRVQRARVAWLQIRIEVEASTRVQKSEPAELRAPRGAGGGVAKPAAQRVVHRRREAVKVGVARRRVEQECLRWRGGVRGEEVPRVAHDRALLGLELAVGAAPRAHERVVVARRGGGATARGVVLDVRLPASEEGEREVARNDLFPVLRAAVAAKRLLRPNDQDDREDSDGDADQRGDEVVQCALGA